MTGRPAEAPAAVRRGQSDRGRRRRSARAGGRWEAVGRLDPVSEERIRGRARVARPLAVGATARRRRLAVSRTTAAIGPTIGRPLPARVERSRGAAGPSATRNSARRPGLRADSRAARPAGATIDRDRRQGVAMRGRSSGARPVVARGTTSGARLAAIGPMNEGRIGAMAATGRDLVRATSGQGHAPAPAGIGRRRAVRRASRTSDPADRRADDHPRGRVVGRRRGQGAARQGVRGPGRRVETVVPAGRARVPADRTEDRAGE